MKFILFCQNPYAFGILQPIEQVLKERKQEYLWFLTKNLRGKFPFPQEQHTYNLQEIIDFESDVIFCPGNEVPHYLRGLKVQIFHGLAGEKKGHFKIRHYFDLYLTQGPYFTRRFNRLRRRHKNFDVIETGWPKLDVYGKDREKYSGEKKQLLQQYNASKILLYAPTFSPSLTSAPYLFNEMKNLAENEDYLLLIKFHDLMSPTLIKQYKIIAEAKENVVLVEEPNIVKFLLMADIVISDTSSVVYEFLLLDKPVITFRSNSRDKLWENVTDVRQLPEKVEQNLGQDPYREERRQIIAEYHPYNDGQSALRMVKAVEEYVKEHGVPEKRKLPFLRKKKMNRIFNRKKSE